MSDTLIDDLSPEDLKTFLTPEEYAEFQKSAAEVQKRTVFWPTAKQLQVVHSEADIVGYGGAAGGGKSYLIAGLAVAHHVRTAIIRPQKNQTRKFVQEITKMLGSRAGFSSLEGWTLTTPDGKERFINFFGLDNPGDEEKQQGDDYDLKCVGAGTLVWMADGSYKPVELVQIGDMVDTLEGPRRVTRTIRQHKSAVLVRTSRGSQVQGTSHQLLGPCGWRSAEDVADRLASMARGFSSAIPSRGACRCAGSLSPTSEAPGPIPCTLPSDREPLLRSAPDRADRRCRSATGVETACIARDSGDGSHYGRSPAREQLPSPSHGAAALCEAPARRSECEAHLPSRHSDAGDGLRGSLLRDWQDRCSFDHCPCGGQPRLCAALGQPNPRQSAGAGPRTPIYLLVDEGRQIPTHSRRRWSWLHPYTKEKRTTDRPVHVVVSEHFDVGVVPLFDLTVEGANHYITQQGFVNRNCYDEATQMREADVRYTLTWNRTDLPDQRVRAVLAFNPPSTPEGRWVVRFFAPWLDKRHPRPAKDGELRWFATVGDDQDYEVAGPQPFIIRMIDGKPTPWYSFNPRDYRPEEIVRPKSRTFIHAKVTDNPYYMATGYMAQLQQLPEPFRSQMLNGDFEAGQEDDAFQVIPTRWIDLAVERGRKRKALLVAGAAKLGPQDSIGCDVARGGNMGSTLGATGHDELVIAKRYGNFIDDLVAHKGVAIDDGAKSAALVIGERRDEAPVHVDVVGVGTSTFDHLVGNHIHALPINGAAQASETTGGQLKLRFANLRAQLHWQLREALDPAGDDPLALPDDPQMAVDLAAARYRLTTQGILVEPKADIKKRIGRSPDRGEAVILANIRTPKLVMSFGGYQLDGHPNMSESYEARRLRELEG